jgi:transcriptional regulator with XRE-family HTH domain
MDRERQRRVGKRFGKRVRQLREARDLTQRALAAACGRPLLSGKIERGESNPALVNDLP